jgi:hypothetical protein
MGTALGVMLCSTKNRRSRGAFMVTSIVSTALLGVDRYRKLRASRHLRQVEHPAVGDLDPAAKEALCSNSTIGSSRSFFGT